MSRLFGTDGVRGVTGTQFTPEMALRLGRAIGAFFGKGSRVLVGRDIRAGGDMVMSAVVSGLLAEGVKVYVAGLAPTPAIQLSVRDSYDGGVAVTASHNPPEYIGVKVIGSDGVEISREEEVVIEEYYHASRASYLEWRSFTDSPQAVHGIIERYVDAILSQVDVEAIAKLGLKAVIDCANSVGALSTPLLLRRLGVRVISVNCHLDPEFPGREPEPTPQSLKEASSLVISAGADLGVGHDGDADRAIFIDEKGRAHWGDRSATLLALHAAEKWRSFPKRVYTGVSSSTLVEEFLAPRGISVVWTPVGSVRIARTLLKEGGIAGFEENGGYIHAPHQFVRDGAMKVALMLDMMASTGKRLSELFDALPQYYSYKTKIKAQRERAPCAIDAVKELFPEHRAIFVDGIKVFGDDFWVLVRPSGTEPVIRIMSEAKTPQRAESIAKEVYKRIEARCLGGDK